MTTTATTEQQVSTWLRDYAWLGTDDEKDREVACIMAQDDWRHIAASAEKFAGQAEDPGPAAADEATEFALSALYECHDGPHLPTCPAVTGRTS